jgi:hypothetical protein
MTVMIFTPDGQAHYFYDPDEIIIEEQKGVSFKAHNDGITQIYKYHKEEETE